MREYSGKDIAYLVSLKKRIVLSHKKCEGKGYIDSVENPCTCMKVFMYIKELYYSKIPSDYWSLSLEELRVKIIYKKIVTDFIENIDNAIEQGLGLFLTGRRGIGKTSLQCEIGKEAIRKRYSVFYVLAQTIVDDRFTEDQHKIQRLKEADIILFDELDKVAMKSDSNIPKQIENLLRELLPNRKSIILCTNMDEQEVEGRFQIMSLIRRYIKIFEMKGDDFSKIRQEQWFDKLKNKDIDFFSKEIVHSAKIFFNNQHIADEKEFSQIF